MTKARATWKGNISFGLVNVPVGLYTVVREHKSPFSQFTEDGHPVGNRPYDKQTGDTITSDQIRRGAVVDDQVVLVTDDELEQFKADGSKQIVIDRFVPDPIPDIWHASDRVAAPLEGGDAAYALLAAGLEARGVVALGTMVECDREKHVLVRSIAGGLLVTTLHYADEVTLDMPARVDVDQKQVGLAVQLIEAMLGDFDATDLVHHRVAAIEELVAMKASGETLTLIKTEEPKAKPDDLLAALEASLAKSA